MSDPHHPCALSGRLRLGPAVALTHIMELVAPRRHRFLTIPSGALLALCLFLPATQACSEPVYPYSVPFAWPPHLLGLLAVIAALRPLRQAGIAGMRRFALVLGLCASAATAWFALWLDGGMLVGLALSLAAAAWLAVGTIVWWRDLDAIAPLPPATVAHHRPPSHDLVPLLTALMVATFVAIAVAVPFHRPPRDPLPDLDLHGVPFGWNGC